MLCIEYLHIKVNMAPTQEGNSPGKTWTGHISF